MRALVAPLEAAIAAEPDQWCLFRQLWETPMSAPPACAAQAGGAA
jgi:hypothetical protein